MALQAKCRNEIIEYLIKKRDERKRQENVDMFKESRKGDDWDLRDKYIFETRFLSRRVTTFRTVDMPLALQAKTFALARRAMLKYYDEHDMARFIKRNLMRLTMLGYWQVIVGTNFASCMTAEHGRYIYFWIGGMGFLVFKIGSYNS